MKPIPPIPKKRVTFLVRNDQDIKDLISDLKDARKKALKTGGNYSVYRSCKDGQIVIDIQLPI